MTVFGGDTGGVDFYFLKCILRCRDLFVRTADVADAGLLSVNAVDLIAHRARALAEDVEAVDRARAGVVEEHANRPFLADWNLEQCLAIEDRAGGGGFGFKQRRASFDLDTFGDRADLQAHVDAGDVARPQRDAFTQVTFETGGLDSDPVVTGSEVGNVVAAFAVGHGFGDK